MAPLSTLKKKAQQSFVTRFKTEKQVNYRAKFIHRTIDLCEVGVRTPSEIYDIDQLEAMRLADNAWNNGDTTTIQNCQYKAGILPDTNTSSATCPSLPISALVHSSESRDNPVSQAEQLVSSVLYELVATGVFQRMDITGLPNLDAETHDIFEVTDEDIYQSVMDAKAVREKNVMTRIAPFVQDLARVAELRERVG